MNVLIRVLLFGIGHVCYFEDGIKLKQIFIFIISQRAFGFDLCTIHACILLLLVGPPQGREILSSLFPLVGSEWALCSSTPAQPCEVPIYQRSNMLCSID